ncbi:MAG TPA: AraC family transcriptional regulator [Blastocatellia bacterium]|nr:AraC family transcriptional regulator [Blastocatellia bacterium]
MRTTAFSGRRLASVDAGWCRVSYRAYEPDAVLDRHAHAHPAINCVLAGTLRETTSAGVVPLDIDEVYVRPAEVPHTNVFGHNGSRLLVIEVCERSPTRVGSLPDLFSRPHVVRSRRVNGYARRLVREARFSDGASLLAVEGLVLCLSAVLVRAELGTEVQLRGRWLEATRSYIDEHFLQPIRLRTLSNVARVHPSHLTRAFKQAVGLTPAVYQRQAQIRWVSRELRDGNKTISQIAIEAGFADHSHLTRAYRAATGSLPSAVRRAAIHGKHSGQGGQT